MWWRLLPASGIFIGIEVVDSNTEAFNWPWWLSLILALFASVLDIIILALIDSTD